MKRKLAAVYMVMALGAAGVLTGCAETTEAAAASTEVQASTKADVPAGEATVTATGRSVAYAEPDRAKVEIGISSFNASAKSAQEDSEEKQTSVKKALTDLGIAEDSISTSYYSMYPRYNYDTGDGTEVTGYSVEATVTVKDLTLDQVGDALSAVTKAGASQISDISYTSSTYDEVYNNALAQAAAEAAGKAGVLAQAEGKTLGSLVHMEEGYQDTSAQYRSSGTSMNMAAAEDAGASSVSIDPGQLEIEASVTSTYSLSD